MLLQEDSFGSFADWNALTQGMSDAEIAFWVELGQAAAQQRFFGQQAALAGAGMDIGIAINAGIGKAYNGMSGVFDGAPKPATFLDDASAPIGRRGNPIDVAPGTNSPATIGGRQYTGHALDRMQGRGIMPRSVDDVIANSPAVPGADGSFIHYSSTNNISVVLNADGSVRTVSYGLFKPR